MLLVIPRVSAPMIAGRALQRCAAVRLPNRFRHLLHAAPATRPPANPQLIREFSSVMRRRDGQEAKAMILTSRMKGARSAREFIAILEEALDTKIFNAFHASAAYHSLSTWRRKGGLQAADLEKHVLDKLNVKLQSMLAKREVNARGFANVLWGVAGLSKAERGFLDVVPALAAYVVVIASDMEAQNVSNSLWSAATLKDASPEVLRMVPILAAQVDSVAKSMKAQEVSNSLWAAATLKEAVHDVVKIVPTLAAQVDVIKKDLNAQGVSNILWAAATLKDAASEVLELVPILAAQVDSIKNDMNAQDVSNNLWSVATLKDAAPDALKMIPTLAAQVDVVVKSMTAQHVSNSLWAAATLKDAAPDLLESVPALLTYLHRTVPRMNAQNISNSLASFVLLQDSVSEVSSLVSPSRVGKHNRNTASEMVQRFKAFLPTMTEADWRLGAPTVVWASAKLGVDDEELLASVSEHFGSKKKCSPLSDWSVCVLQWSCNALDSTERFKGFHKTLNAVIRSRGLSESDVQRSQYGPVHFFATR